MIYDVSIKEKVQDPESLSWLFYDADIFKVEADGFNNAIKKAKALYRMETPKPINKSLITYKLLRHD